MCKHNADVFIGLIDANNLFIINKENLKNLVLNYYISSFIKTTMLNIR